MNVNLFDFETPGSAHFPNTKYAGSSSMNLFFGKRLRSMLDCQGQQIKSADCLWLTSCLGQQGSALELAPSRDNRLGQVQRLGNCAWRSDGHGRLRTIVATTAAGSIALVTSGASSLLARATWCALSEVRQEFWLASHKGWISVHVGIRTSSYFAKAILRSVDVKRTR
jgi:hypothetical protein